MRILLRLMKESSSIAIHALVSNLVRTILSLLGVSIGIWIIITVLSVVDAMESGVKDSIESLGTKVVFVQKWPWSFDDDYAWWEYLNRPQPSVDDLEAIQERSELTESVAYIMGTSKTIKRASSSMSGVSLVCASHQYNEVRSFELEGGRYFTETESERGSRVAVIGSDVALGLFGSLNPVGRTIRVSGLKAEVVGVFKREGESMIGYSTDNEVLIPLNFARQFLDIKNSNLDQQIMVKAYPEVEIDALRDELMGILRGARRLKPLEDENFALNEVGILTTGFQPVFDILNVVGWFLGFLSLLIGGFGTANIMFVSVRERTNIIGIQKSLGAKNWFVLFQFLVEAVILCLIGGALGLVLVGLSLLAFLAFDFTVPLTFFNVFFGFFIATAIGLIAGFVPALMAARLNPVDAIRST